MTTGRSARSGVVNGPVIMLAYAHSGADRVQDALAAGTKLACTAGTGIIPLCAAAAELELIIISDEIYGDLMHDPQQVVRSPAAIAPDRTVVTTARARSGWLAQTRAAVTRAGRYAAASSSRAPTCPNRS